MKYIGYIIGVVLLTSLAAGGYEFFTPPPEAGDADLIINGRVIKAEELAAKAERLPYSHRDSKQLLSDVITRELLIQEAQKARIDREEAFRQSIENFFEQSLIKTLLDHKFDSLEISVTDAELASVQENLEKKFDLTIRHYSSEEAARLGLPERTETREANLLEIPLDYRDKVLSLEPGETCPPFPAEDGFATLLLSGIKEDSGQDYDEEEIREILLAEKKKRVMAAWLTKMRGKASITLPAGQEERGGR